MDAERLQEMAALWSLGALEGDPAREFERLLADADPDALREAALFRDLAGRLGAAVPAHAAPPSLKARVLQAIEGRVRARQLRQRLRQSLPLLQDGFAVVRGDEPAAWIPLPVAGAFIRLLAFDEPHGYAVVMGKLEAGARYPAHVHFGSEQVYVLTGDLHLGEKVLQAGDFHHSEAGTAHGVNFSEHGCTILAVVSTETLLRQFTG